MTNLTFISKRLWKILSCNCAAGLVEPFCSKFTCLKKNSLMNFLDCAVKRTKGVGAVYVLKDSFKRSPFN